MKAALALVIALGTVAAYAAEPTSAPAAAPAAPAAATAPAKTETAPAATTAKADMPAETGKKKHKKNKH